MKRLVQVAQYYFQHYAHLIYIYIYIQTLQLYHIVTFFESCFFLGSKVTYLDSSYKIVEVADSKQTKYIWLVNIEINSKHYLCRKISLLRIGFLESVHTINLVQLDIGSANNTKSNPAMCACRFLPCLYKLNRSTVLIYIYIYMYKEMYTRCMLEQQRK